MTFGEYARAKRLRNSMSLRSFCKRYGYDPAYISRIERGVLPPQLKESWLIEYAKNIDAKDYNRFRAMAYIAKEKIPPEAINNDVVDLDRMACLFGRIKA